MDHVTGIPIDIVIPTRNRPEQIGAAIASVRASEAALIRLVVVDQSDDERTAAVVARHSAEDPRVTYLRTAPQGISHARNLGVAAGTAPYILFTDDDCRVAPDWARAMAAALAEPGIWATFGRVLPEPAPDHGVAEAAPGVVLGVKLSTERQVFAGPRWNLGFGHGASMGVRRERLTALGGFDPLLGTGAPLRSWEDRDLGYRVLAAGGRIVYTPAAVVRHRQWRPWPQVRRATHDYAIGAGATAAKYLRLGDIGGLVLLGDWIVDQGVRQVASGVLKWRSPRKLWVGLQQATLPWYGLLLGLRHPLDRRLRIYRPPLAIHH